jgi:hypothetical protein
MQRKRAQGVPDARRLTGNLLHGICIGFFKGQIVKNAGILYVLVQSPEFGNLVGKLGAFLQNGAALFGVVPEFFLGDQTFDFVQPFVLAGQVKDTS